MTFNLQWEGEATAFVPEHLKTLGKPGPIAESCKNAIWEAVQAAAERSAHAQVRVQANGWEDRDNPGFGKFNLAIEVRNPPDEMTQQVNAQLSQQQPIDLRETTPEPAPAPSTGG